MRSVLAFVLSCFLSAAVPAKTQQTQPTQTQTSRVQSTASQEAQALGVLDQALVVAGGLPAIRAITDYTAIGNITYHWNSEEQGSVTIQGSGMSQIRIDSSLPSGEHSEAIHDGQSSRKRPDGTLRQYPPPYPTPSSEAFPYQPPMFPGSFVIPHEQLAVIVNNPSYSISFKGISQVDGVAVYDIQAQWILPAQTQPDKMAEYHTIEIFINTSTLQIAMTQDNVPNHIVHRIRYSDYRTVNGVLVPFSIIEETGGQKTRDFQLSQISFNRGLQDSAFTIQ